MMSVTSPPTIARSTSRVWIRPARVGSTVISCESSGLLVACPAQPLPNRAERADPAAEPAPGQVIGDLLGRHLQPEEGVHAGEVAAQRCRAGGVHHAGP